MIKSREIIDIISTAKTFNSTPSDIIGIDVEYVYLRYCFDEACNYLYLMMQPDKDGKTKQPNFPRTDKSQNPGLDLLLGS